MTFIDELIQRLQSSARSNPAAASPINAGLELLRGTAFENDVALLGDLVAAIKSGDLTGFLEQNDIGPAEVEAIGHVIDQMASASPKSPRSSKSWKDAGGDTGDWRDAPRGMASASIDVAALKKQLGEASAASTGSIVTTREYRSPKQAYDALIKEIRAANDGELPTGTPMFDEWLRINGITSSAVIPKGTPITMTPYRTYVGKAGDTFRSIAESQNVDLAELMKINGVTDPEASATGAKLLVPASKAPLPTGGRGEQTQPESQPGYDPSNPSTEPSTDPGDPFLPGSDVNVEGEDNRPPLLKALEDQGMDQFVYEALAGKGWAPGKISSVLDRAPQLDAIRWLKNQMSGAENPLSGGGDELGLATNLLNNYLDSGLVDYGSLDSMLRTLAAGDADSHFDDLGLEGLVNIIANANQGRYSQGAMRTMFGPTAMRELQMKYNNAGTGTTMLEFLLAELMGG